MVLRFQSDQHPIIEKDICRNARIILQRLTEANYEAYLVGGAIRDLLQGIKPKDFDIATNAHPEEIKKVFSNSRLIGRRFRLAHIYFGNEYYEVATFRAPHGDSDSGVVSQDGRIIHDNVYGSMEEDALRRDFTVNALYYDMQTGEVVDYASGMDDVDRRELRLIGVPETRYREDPVRMLRAIRFAAKLGFSIEDSTEKPITELAPLLGNIAPARLFDEALKLFHSGFAVEVFKKLLQYELFDYLFPIARRAIDEDEDGRKFIERALSNTDARISEGKPVTPAFLFAVMLWHEQQRLTKKYQEQGEPEYQANQLAASDVFKDQVKSTAVPRRFSNITRDIWLLQSRFHRRDCRAANYFVEHKRFRAAYDFFCLRSKIYPELDEVCRWWTQFYDSNEEERMEMCKAMPSSRKRRRGRRRRKK